MTDKPQELTVYHCDKLKSFAELVKKVKESFPEISFEELDIQLGIVSIIVKLKE